MADVRSMLRAERQSRRLTHPHASYTSQGKLLCNLCDAAVKSEAHWQAHLHSTQHTVRSQRARQAATVKVTDGGKRKRKADSPDDSPGPDDRKKARQSAPIEHDREQTLSTSMDKVGKVQHGQSEAVVEGASLEESEFEAPMNQQNVQNDIDEAELAAFERNLQELEREFQAPSAVHTEATITAAPMTAEEVAAQTKEEQQKQRGRQEAEVQEEKEDAARVLEEEFDEMDGLEERLKKLRERREALRVVGDKGDMEPDAQDPGVVGLEATEESSDEEEDDGWHFGGG